jgi:putative nucleotidyltransferase with HDIG domain
MKLLIQPQQGPPRLLIKALRFSFGMIVVVLGAVFLVVSWQTRTRLVQSAVQGLEAGQRHFADLEDRRQREQRLRALTLAQNPTLKAAVDTYHAELGTGAPVDQLRSTIQLELAKLQQTMQVPALSIADVRGTILASVGPAAADWVVGQAVRATVDAEAEAGDLVIARGNSVYQATVVPLRLGADPIGTFFLATPLDDRLAAELAQASLADIVILLDGRLVASSVPYALGRAIESASLPARGTVRLEDEEYVIRRLSAVGPVGTYALASIGAASRAAWSDAASTLAGLGLFAMLLSAAGSWGLARALSSPIDELSRELADMARTRDFERPLPRSGASQELETLADTFDELRRAVLMAEAESEAAYLGVIRALAAALDLRDPYTAGHSERVAAIAVAIGHKMQLSGHDIEVLRLGSLLHDIGKIGVSDAVLRKPGALTPEEFEQIKQHPALGARILRSLLFFSDHLAIVELHHERLDGRGYPHGLKGDAIPLLARIVHVADTFDAITSARAYRPARSTGEALDELWRYVDTDFDRQVVEAITLVCRGQSGASGEVVDAEPVSAPARPSSWTRGAARPEEGKRTRRDPMDLRVLVAAGLREHGPRPGCARRGAPEDRARYGRRLAGLLR